MEKMLSQHLFGLIVKYKVVSRQWSVVSRCFSDGPPIGEQRFSGFYNYAQSDKPLRNTRLPNEQDNLGSSAFWAKFAQNAPENKSSEH
jgi:hypothetical protein